MKNRELKTIIKMFEESSLSSMKLEKEDVKIELNKPNGNREVHVPHSDSTQDVLQEASSQTSEAPEKSEDLVPIKAPLVGTFYESPSPEKGPFVKEGQWVNKGDTVCIIEAMKVMNEISAPHDGRMISIHAGDGDMVQYDQVIMELKP